MRKRTVRRILLAVAVPVFLFSGVMVAKYHREMSAESKYMETLVEMAVTVSAEASGDQSVQEAAGELPIEVDFDVLCKENQNVVGWLYCPDTPINYPVVQAADNDFYLHRLLDGSYNAAGSLFMDYRNSADFSDWNSVIYGHNMRYDSMFGTLPDYKAQSYFEAHPVIFLLTPEQNYKINLLAGFVTPANAGLYSAFNPSEGKRASFVEKWMNASDFDSASVPVPGCKFITLSTCSYEYSNARYVVVGILEEV